MKAEVVVLLMYTTDTKKEVSPIATRFGRPERGYLWNEE